MSNSPKSSSNKKKDVTELAGIAERLGAHLKALEAEYLHLEAELKKKKARRAKLAEKRAANPGWSDEAARRRAVRLQRNIDQSGAYVQKQSRFLRKVKAFHERNERLLEMIAERLSVLETRLEGPDGPSPEARVKFQQELMQMLGELQSMRTKREQLQQAAQ